MFRLCAGIATLAFLGLLPMATAAMVVALIGVALASLALIQLNTRTSELADITRRNRETAADLAGRGGDDGDHDV